MTGTYRSIRLAVTALAILILSSGCLPFVDVVSVDSTEHCLATRYGAVTNERLGSGMNWLWLEKATCFDLTQRRWPEPMEDGDGNAIAQVVEAQTADPVTVQGDVSVEWALDPATVVQVFREKRNQDAINATVTDAIREGYRNALNGWTVSRIFSADRSKLAPDVKRQIEAKLGGRAKIINVYVRNIAIPQEIEAARVQSAKQAQILAQARQQAEIDSVNAYAQVVKARGDAEAKRLEAQSYATNPALLQLEIAKQQALGLGNAFSKCTTNCVIGGSIADTWAR